MSNYIPPDGAIKIELDHGVGCPHCKNPLNPDVIDYYKRETENPDKWRIMQVFALFQCVACKGFYYLDYVERAGEW